MSEGEGGGGWGAEGREPCILMVDYFDTTCALCSEPVLAFHFPVSCRVCSMDKLLSPINVKCLSIDCAQDLTLFFFKPSFLQGSLLSLCNVSIAMNLLLLDFRCQHICVCVYSISLYILNSLSSLLSDSSFCPPPQFLLYLLSCFSHSCFSHEHSQGNAAQYEEDNDDDDGL